MIAKKLFPKDPELIAKKLDSREWLPEEEFLLKKLVSLGYKEVMCEKNLQYKGIGVLHEEDNPGKKQLQESFRGLAVSLKWVTSQAELNELMSKIQVTRTKGQLRVVSRDKILMHAVGVLEELEKQLNSFTERLREWYGLHFPELSKELQSHEKFLELVSRHGERSRVEGYESLAKGSVGMDFSESDIREVQEVAKGLLQLCQTRKSLEAYLEKSCKEIIPNVSAVAGEVLGARLLAQAGGLEKLARLPSSTVQVLGAEKALFRHLKGGGRAPKFGVLFAHPLVQNADYDRRGKVARLIAAKISLAARTDFYSKKNTGSAFRKELERQVAMLKPENNSAKT